MLSFFQQKNFFESVHADAKTTIALDEAEGNGTIDYRMDDRDVIYSPQGLLAYRN